MQQTLKMTPFELVSEATATCIAFTELLTGENQALEARKVKAVNENIKLKTRFAAKLDRLMKQLAQAKDAVRTDPMAQRITHKLKDSFNAYQQASKRNLVLLKSAHDTTASVVEVIHRAVQAQVNPKANVYGANGQMQKNLTGAKAGRSGTVNKSI